MRTMRGSITRRGHHERRGGPVYGANDPGRAAHTYFDPDLPGYAEPMALGRPDDLIAPSVVASRVRFILGLVLVTIAAGAFAVAFRASLTAVYQRFYGADNVVDAITTLPRWLRLTVPVAAA